MRGLCQQKIKVSGKWFFKFPDLRGAGKLLNLHSHKIADFRANKNPNHLVYICLSETTNYMSMTTRTLKRAKCKLAATRWRASDRSCLACRRCQTCICLMPYKTYHQIWQGVAVTVKWCCLFRETHSATHRMYVYILNIYIHAHRRTPSIVRIHRIKSE